MQARLERDRNVIGHALAVLRFVQRPVVDEYRHLHCVPQLELELAIAVDGEKPVIAKTSFGRDAEFRQPLFGYRRKHGSRLPLLLRQQPCPLEQRPPGILYDASGSFGRISNSSGEETRLLCPAGAMAAACMCHRAETENFRIERKLGHLAASLSQRAASLREDDSDRPRAIWLATESGSPQRTGRLSTRSIVTSPSRFATVTGSSTPPRVSIGSPLTAITRSS